MLISVDLFLSAFDFLAFFLSISFRRRFRRSWQVCQTLGMMLAIYVALGWDVNRGRRFCA